MNLIERIDKTLENGYSSLGNYSALSIWELLSECRTEIQRLLTANEALKGLCDEYQAQIKAQGEYVPMTAQGCEMKANKLPAPRLQLRWEKIGEYEWHCHYELVIMLGKFDIRRDEIKGNSGKLVVTMKPPTVRGGSGVPCGETAQRYADTPFRDGAHAKWDSLQLGNLPIFVIAPDGEAFRVEAAKDKIGEAK